jgi:hypothetical protein
MELHDRASGSHDCGPQISQICAHTGGTLTRQPTAPNGGSRATAATSDRHAARLAIQSGNL